MKFIFFLYLFSFLSITTKAQNQSFLYNEKGQFLLDTTLTISKGQYITWKFAEYNLVAGFSRIEIPDLILEGTIQPPITKRPLIVSFVCDTSDISEIKILNDSSAYANAVIVGLKKQGSRISSLLKSRSNFSSPAIYLGKYYVAFDFNVINFYEQLKTKKAVPIYKCTIPGIDVMMH